MFLTNYNTKYKDIIVKNNVNYTGMKYMTYLPTNVCFNTGNSFILRLHTEN